MNPSWVQIALSEQGQAELTGSAHNPRIVAYHATTSLKAVTDETPWCASFAGWCLKSAGLDSAGSARALDYASYGEALDAPVLGAIMVFTRSGGGHVGFYMGTDPKSGNLLILGGNQSNRVSIAPYSPDRLLAIRWPEGAPLPNAVAPLSKSGVIRGNLLAGASTIGSIGAGLIANAPSVDQAQRWMSQGGTVALILGLIALSGIVWSIVSRAKGKAQEALSQ